MSDAASYQNYLALKGVPAGRLSHEDKSLWQAPNIPEHYMDVPAIVGSLERGQKIPGLGGFHMHRAFAEQLREALPAYSKSLHEAWGNTGGWSNPPNMGIDTFRWHNPGGRPQVVSTWSPSYGRVHSELAAAARQTPAETQLPAFGAKYKQLGEADRDYFMGEVAEAQPQLERGARQHIYSMFPMCGQAGCAPFFGGTEDYPGFLKDIGRSSLLYSVPTHGPRHFQPPEMWKFLQDTVLPYERRAPYAKGGSVKRPIQTTLSLLKWLKSVA